MQQLFAAWMFLERLEGRHTLAALLEFIRKRNRLARWRRWF